MSQPEPLIRNISDTACWVAVYRRALFERLGRQATSSRPWSGVFLAERM